MISYESTSERGNLVLGRRYSTGYAARNNRSRRSGVKIHRIVIEEIVAVKDEAAELALKHATLGKRFLQSRKPELFSAAPLCGCCQGQYAASEAPGREVTCDKCK